MEIRGSISAVTKGEYPHQSIVTMAERESRGGKVAVCVKQGEGNCSCTLEVGDRERREVKSGRCRRERGGGRLEGRRQGTSPLKRFSVTSETEVEEQRILLEYNHRGDNVTYQEVPHKSLIPAFSPVLTPRSSAEHFDPA
jgi:hypothetical protein